jgi:hypothetical protein
MIAAFTAFHTVIFQLYFFEFAILFHLIKQLFYLLFYLSKLAVNVRSLPQDRNEQQNN